MVHTYRLTIVTDQPLVDGHVLRDAIGDVIYGGEVTDITEVKPTVVAEELDHQPPVSRVWWEE